jgi:uracil-DNA glycosylase
MTRRRDPRDLLDLLGSAAWSGTLRALADLGPSLRPTPRFAHAVETVVGGYRLLGCYHPSQQNTFTGRLTASMLDAVRQRARETLRRPRASG